MCFICDIRSMVDQAEMDPRNAVHAVATASRNHIAKAIAEAPRTAKALFGDDLVDDENGGCNVEFVLNGDVTTGTQTLDVRVPDGQRGLRVTYAVADYAAGSVSYTGNGPDGQSTIGIDAIDAALDHISTKVNGIEAIMTVAGPKRGNVDFQHELEMAQLIKRCLTALRENAEQNSRAE